MLLHIDVLYCTWNMLFNAISESMCPVHGAESPPPAVSGDLSHLRAVRTVSAHQFADDNGMYTFFMSAKSGDQVRGGGGGKGLLCF